jgi:tRNA (guanine37-N1)-methyltransferase
MRVDIITIFPDMFGEVFRFGIVRRACEAGLLDIQVHDLRSWTRDRHRTTDDVPYGGGPGMVMKAEPLVRAVESIVQRDPPDDSRDVVLLSPRGKLLEQDDVRQMSTKNQIVLVSGRYEGVDERFLQLTGAREISIGDYVLSGGEIPAMVVVDSITRLIPGAISDPESHAEDSFSRGLLDYPHYTRPARIRDVGVPETLLSGNHAAVRRWRKERALRDTASRRPELLTKASLDDEERSILERGSNGSKDRLTN